MNKRRNKIISMFYVEQKYYYDGHSEARLLPEYAALDLGYYHGYYRKHLAYELYVDVFASFSKAAEAVKEVKSLPDAA